MAPNNFSSILHKRTNKITRVLSYAILEWVLIFFLLLNSLFSYFILKFALYFGLKPPCLLCSRIDHFLDSHKEENQKKPSFFSYTEIICEQHAAEISKIGYCSHHRKLVESQYMCDDCSSSSSSHDPQLFKWMTEIGIVKDDAEEEGEVISKKCSCCDGVINPISKVSSLDFVIKERGLLGDSYSDQKLQDNFDKSDDSKFGYQVLVDGAEEEAEEGEQSEEELILVAEKEPLLLNINDSNGKNKEIVTTQNLCPDMLPQHLEFYIDHDDYRLIPVELIDDNSTKVGGKEEEKKEISEFSREFELIFEGFNLVLPRCEVTPTKDLPSIQEEEESVIQNLPISKYEEKLVGSDKFELGFEEDELLQETKIGNLHIHDEKMEDSDKFELNFEGDELIAECKIISANFPKEEQEREIKNLQIHENEEVEENEVEVEDENENEEEQEILQSSEFLQEQEKEEKRENSLLLEEQKDATAEGSAHISDEQESNNQAIEADIQATAETHSTPSVSEEDNASHLENEETDTEKQNQIPSDKLFIQEHKEDNASHLRNYEIEIEVETETETERSQNFTDNLLIQECNEDISSHLEFHEAERKQNQKADDLLIVMDELPEPCKLESHTIIDNVVSDVSTSYPHDAEISERSLNANVGMSHNEVEEERVPDTPTSSESLGHLHRKLSFLGRRESVTEESLDGMSMISEQESAETMEKLKIDLIAERKALRTLYKELEEERNASAIAANQTMAMITRLQEEKATMQMEALQYQRMMEEQSEYDQEALQMMNELVVKREKEKQKLEKELEVYRKKVIDYEEKEKMRMLCRRRSRNSSTSCSYGEESDGLSIDLNQEMKDQEEDDGISPHCHEENGHQDTPTNAVLCLQDSLSCFDEERQAILGQLKVLEEKLFTLAEEEEEHFENMKPFEQFYEENGKDFDVTNGVDNNGFIHANGKHQQERRINGSVPKRLLPLFDAELLESPNGELNGTEDNEFHLTKFELEKKRFAIEEEVDHVYERLQALEADREFLKHCMGSLRKGDKGLDLLQEILQHLRDLKNVELQAMKNTDQCASV